MPADIPSAADWVASGRWMRGRAGTGGKTYVEVDGHRHRTRAMKGVGGSLYSDAEMVRRLGKTIPDEFHVMEKSEGGKVRPVVKTGNDANRKMDYLSEWVEKGLYSSRTSTLFAGPAGNEMIDFDLLETTRDPGWWKVPLDQKNFDQHQSHASIMAVMGAIGEFIWERESGADFRTTWKALWASLFERDVSVLCGNLRYTWGNGLPSGWRWTAVLDTILNIASFAVAKDVATSILGEDFTLRSHYAQGDDIIFGVRKVSEAEALVQLEAQLITGHGNFREYLHRMGFAPTANCACDDSPDTPEHRIFQCKLEDQWRNITMNGITWHPMAQGRTRNDDPKQGQQLVEILLQESIEHEVPALRTWVASPPPLLPPHVVSAI